MNSFFIVQMVQILKYLVRFATPYCFEVGVRVGPSLLSARCAQHRLSRNRQPFMLELLMPFSSRKSQRISGLHNTGKRMIYGFPYAVGWLLPHTANHYLPRFPVIFVASNMSFSTRRYAVYYCIASSDDCQISCAQNLHDLISDTKAPISPLSAMNLFRT